MSNWESGLRSARLAQGAALPPARRRRRRLEASVEEPCRVHAQERGWVSRKMNGLGFRAWPDRQFLPPPVRRGTPHKCQRFWVEFKREGEELTPEQRRMRADLVARGESVHTCRTKEEFIHVFKAHGGY